MILVTAEGLTKSYGENALLNGVSLSLSQGDKVGIVGVNGAGKSTLLKLIAGAEEADGGSLTFSNGARLSYLMQNPQMEGGRTLLQQVLLGCGGAAAQEYEAKTVLTRLGLEEFDKPVAKLSGGQKRRAAIASALLHPCDMMILDEPTNHIDNETAEYLETALKAYRGALLMVTHDRYFLERICNRIWEISNGSLYTYPGNYSKFLELKAQREEMEEASERKRQSLLRRELAWIKRGARARGTKSRVRQERFDQLSDQQGPQQAQKLELNSIASRLGKQIVEIRDLGHGYDGTMLFRGLSLLLSRDARIGIVGPNGAGKSTFLKLIAGRLQPLAGEIICGKTVRIGYFSQEGEELPESERVIDYIRSIAAYIHTPQGEVSASQMLEKFLFPQQMQYTAIGRLSGGEKRRLALLSTIMHAPNVLLLDEPTNDIDIETLTVLEDFLDSFEGAVLAVSHDRYFLDRIAQRILEFNGTVREYLGGYTEYREKKLEDKPEKQPDKKPPVKQEAKARTKLSFKERYELEHIDEEIAKLEEKVKKLEQDIALSSSDFAALERLIAEKEEAETALTEKMERWVTLQELAEELEGAQ